MLTAGLKSKRTSIKSSCHDIYAVLQEAMDFPCNIACQVQEFFSSIGFACHVSDDCVNIVMLTPCGKALNPGRQSC